MYLERSVGPDGRSNDAWSTETSSARSQCSRLLRGTVVSRQGRISRFRQFGASALPQA